MSARTLLKNFTAMLALASGLLIPTSLLAQQSAPPVGQQSASQAPPTIPSSVLDEHVVHREKARYPSIAREAHVMGTVVLGVEVNEQGQLTKLAMISGPPMLRQAAVDAIRKWTFSPVQIDGKPETVRSVVQFSFMHLSSRTSD